MLDDTQSGSLSRRSFLRWTSRGLIAPLLLKAQAPLEIPLKQSKLLEEMEHRACHYFYDEAHPKTGLVRDRVRIVGPDTRRIASIASTGFGLSALAIACQNGFLDSDEALSRTEKTLTFLARSAPRHHGFYYHFCDMETGERAWQSEVSSIDTAWLLCGVIHARAHFNTPRIRRLASEILDRVNWRWMWDGGPTLSHGWTPEKGFLPYRWDSYSELLAMYLLAIGSTTFPIPASSWDAWTRPNKQSDSDSFIQSIAPLFVHQYSHAWFDFRGKQDGYTDYFLNSQRATEAHRQFCIGLAQKFPWYSGDLWGVTASDSREGYTAWGGPASGAKIDGTLVPCAAGGSLVFLPDECIKVLETMLERYGRRVWNEYGFVDAFHPRENWYSPDVIGIDLGIMLLMAENLRNENVWKTVMQTPEAAAGMLAAGFYSA